VAIDKACAPPFGYWIPLTASVVLRPYAGSTLQRAVERLLGTAAGIVVGMALMALAGSDAARALLTLAAFFGSLAVLPLNYGLAIGFLSVGLVPFEALLVGAAVPEIGALRLLSTLVGGALALAGGFLLWPSFERGSLPSLIATSLASLARYADLVLALHAGAPGNPERLAAQRQRVGVDLSNAQATLQRVVGEHGHKPADLFACLIAIATLQRLFVSLTAVREVAAAAEACPALAQLRAGSVAALAELAETLAAGRRGPPAALPSPGPGQAPGAADPLLAYEIERITLQIATLRTACARLPTG
jgi:uncharacterized membrane protein YccC